MRSKSRDEKGSLLLYMQAQKPQGGGGGGGGVPGTPFQTIMNKFIKRCLFIMDPAESS